MGLDIRWPIGLMFSLVGIMLLLYGLFTNSNTEMYQRSLGINVNIYWGVLLVVFGAAMLIMARRGAKAVAAEEAARTGAAGSKAQDKR